MTAIPNPFLSAEPPSTEKAPASNDWNPEDVGAAISLSELCDRGFDLESFMAAIEPPPLFLQRVG